MKKRLLLKSAALMIVATAMASNLQWAYNDYGLKEIALNRNIASQGKETFHSLLSDKIYASTDATGGSSSSYIYQYEIQRSRTQMVSESSIDLNFSYSVNGDGTITFDTKVGSVTASGGGSDGTIQGGGAVRTVSYTECYIACVDGTRFPAPCTPFWTRYN